MHLYEHKRGSTNLSPERLKAKPAILFRIDLIMAVHRLHTQYPDFGRYLIPD